VAFGDLTNLPDVRAWLQNGQSSFPITDDALLSRLITAASQYIQTSLNRQIALADYIEVRDGTGGHRLQFGCFPVMTVQSLTVDGQTVPRSASSSSAGYSFSTSQLSIRGYKFSYGAQNVVIAYTAGYATTPPDIAQACVELVALRYRERTRIGEISKSLGGLETVSYSQKDLSDPIKTLLQQYRLVSPIVAIRPTVASTGVDSVIISGVL
jgi:hypothetical protein